MKNIKTINDQLTEYIKALAYCMKLSWGASRYYTILRIICEVSRPILGIVNAFLGKYLINLFTGNYVIHDKYLACLGLMVCISVAGFLQRGGSSLVQYMQSMHNNILNEKLALMLMDCSVKADMEYYDNTEYYDKLQASARDSYSMSSIMWNALMFLSSMISFIGVFAVLWVANPLYGILLAFAAIPSAIVSTKLTKSIYHLSMEQLKSERRKGYYQGIAMDKRYVQDIRLFRKGEFLKEKHYGMWKEIFVKQRKVSRRRAIAAIFWGCLPEGVSTGIGIHIGFRILNGASTVGDYSLYTGLIGQFLYACSCLTMSFTDIYDNKLRIINLRSIFDFENHMLDLGKMELKEIENIEFEHVSFAYPNTKRMVLEDISFQLHRGVDDGMVRIRKVLILRHLDCLIFGICIMKYKEKMNLL